MCRRRKFQLCRFNYGLVSNSANAGAAFAELMSIFAETANFNSCELGLAPRTAEVDGCACLFQDMRRLIRHRHAAHGVLETFRGWWRGSLVDSVPFVAWVGLHVHSCTPALLNCIRQVNLAPREAQRPKRRECGDETPNHPECANAQTHAPEQAHPAKWATPPFVQVIHASRIRTPASSFVLACV